VISDKWLRVILYAHGNNGAVYHRPVPITWKEIKILGFVLTVTFKGKERPLKVQEIEISFIKGCSCLVLRNNFDVRRNVDFHQCKVYILETKYIKPKMIFQTIFITAAIATEKVERILKALKFLPSQTEYFFLKIFV